MLYLPSKLSNPKLVNQRLITEKNGRTVKPINNKTHAWNGAKKRKRGKDVPKNKHVFTIVSVWAGLNTLTKVIVAFELKYYDPEGFSMYKLRNKYSIMHTATGKDIYQYPCRLFGAYKKLHNKGFVEDFYKKLVEFKYSNNAELLEFIKKHIIATSEIERKQDKAKKKK